MINANPAERALKVANERPNGDKLLVPLIIDNGLVIKYTPNSPIKTATHLYGPIFSPKKNGANNVTNIAELCARAVTKPIGIN